jgi:hypothetical protein
MFEPSPPAISELAPRRRAAALPGRHACALGCGRHIHLPVLRRLSQWTIVLLLIISVGGHWAILQSVAWAGMLARFSQTMSFSQAVQNTFDGQHPCALCQAVKQGQEAERKESQFQPPEKLTLCLNSQPATLPLPPAAIHAFAATAHPGCFLAQPPHPPPRAA